MGEKPGLTLKPFFHNDGALIPMKLVANFLITQRSVKLLRRNRRRHPQSSNTSAGSSSMNDIHQLPTDTATLVCRINENASNNITVEACSADNNFA
ncbi:hypothetical protein ALP70_200215 [Pseudomonas savastanoi]|uniref:Uncharacterized protein n=1 Tax=Pseudomonas savastanoi TaxID=29438 RepID=A0A3M5AYM6_PSESS|nr:hypothetical protein ALP70_200215 [Pseudomonas savastanoi]